jgi:hypothetical protein
MLLLMLISVGSAAAQPERAYAAITYSLVDGSAIVLSLVDSGDGTISAVDDAEGSVS